MEKKYSKQDVLDFLKEFDVSYGGKHFLNKDYISDILDDFKSDNPKGYFEDLEVGFSVCDKLQYYSPSKNMAHFIRTRLDEDDINFIIQSMKGNKTFKIWEHQYRASIDVFEYLIEETIKMKCPKYRKNKIRSYTSRKTIRDHVFNRDGKICKFCGATNNLSLDHIIPISKNGENSLENLQVLCMPCNRKKGIE